MLSLQNLAKPLRITSRPWTTSPTLTKSPAAGPSCPDIAPRSLPTPSSSKGTAASTPWPWRRSSAVTSSTLTPTPDPSRSTATPCPSATTKSTSTRFKPRRSSSEWVFFNLENGRQMSDRQSALPISPWFPVQDHEMGLNVQHLFVPESLDSIWRQLCQRHPRSFRQGRALRPLRQLQPQQVRRDGGQRRQSTGLRGRHGQRLQMAMLNHSKTVEIQS